MGIYHFLMIIIMGSPDAPSVGIYRRISKTSGGRGGNPQSDSSGSPAITSPCWSTQLTNPTSEKFLNSKPSPYRKERNMYCTLLLLYLFKCTSDKSCIQAGQGLSQSYYAHTGVFNTLFYSHLLSPQCYCCSSCCQLEKQAIQTLNQTHSKSGWANWIYFWKDFFFLSYSNTYFKIKVVIVICIVNKG